MILHEGDLPKVGMISFYGKGFDGRPTASGERFDQSASTAAAIGLPFGFRLKVTHLGNGRSVVVRVNDRGPYVRVKGKFVPHPTRMIDVSQGAAEALGMIQEGIARVRIEKAT